jgi:hypothetical protein
MRPHMTAATALASCLILAAATAAYAAPPINLKPAVDASTSPVELVKKGGGGGGPRGGGYKGGGDKGGKAFSGGGGGGKHRGDFARKGGGDSHARKGGGGHYAYKGGKDHYAGKGHKGDHHKHHRYGKHYRYYPGIFTYGAYSYYDECDWLRRKARVTGSPYWWQRYQECVYYY